MKLSLQVFVKSVKSISLTKINKKLHFFADIFELTNFFVKLLLPNFISRIFWSLLYALSRFTVLLTAKSFSRKVLKSLRCHPWYHLQRLATLENTPQFTVVVVHSFFLLLCSRNNKWAKWEFTPCLWFLLANK